MQNSTQSNRRTLSTKLESLDYDLIENVIFLEHQHKSKISKFLDRDLQRWIAIFLIAFATALSGFFASVTVKTLTELKFSQIINTTNSRCPQSNHGDNSTNPLSTLQQIQCILPSYLIWILWNIIPCLFGSILVTYLAPIAAGSGIPVVKCYLNGVKIPEVVRFKTYLAKLLGVIASVVGGLVAGKEGPFVHCGAALGAGISQGKSSTFKCGTPLFRSFRNDRDKRDFVSAGASAGVAAAFGAPIGGVLFALEEGASFWNQALTWRLFFCSMMTSFILNILMITFNHKTGVLAFYSLANFGLVEELDYFWFEIPIYLCIAVFGGAIGASFCYFNLQLAKLRKKYLAEKWLKVLEVVIVSVVIASAGVILIVLAPECRKIPTSDSELIMPSHEKSYDFLSWTNLWNSQIKDRSKLHPLSYDSDREIRKALSNHVFTFMCPKGEYSAMSSLWLKTSEGASSTFMVLQDDIWSIQTLFLFMIVYYILAIITYGLSVSSGVFIPSLLIGATGGRLIGLLLRYTLGPHEWLEQLNKFAIIGAVSVLGGVVRMTISLTVIVIEATGCISFGLPIMICLMVSKWVADSFIEGLYDLAIHMANVPFLEWEPPSKSYSIYASDVMSHDVKVLRTTETVANLINILQSCPHNGFPVIDLPDEESKSHDTRQVSGDYSSTYYDYHTPTQSPMINTPARADLFGQSVTSDTRTLVDDSAGRLDQDFLIGSFQRCSITAKRESYGRFRGLVLRWQILIMLKLKIFNENERSYENLNLRAFQKMYPRYPELEDIISGLSDEMYGYHVDLRSVMNTGSHTVSYTASFPRIYQLFRSLGLRHLVVIDDRNQVVGMITRKDLARYVKHRNGNGEIRFEELKYS